MKSDDGDGAKDDTGDGDDDDNALWVKSGNRGNLKCLKVNDHYVRLVPNTYQK